MTPPVQDEHLSACLQQTSRLYLLNVKMPSSVLALAEDSSRTWFRCLVHCQTGSGCCHPWYFPSEGTERLPKTLTPKEKEKVETYKER